MRFGLNDSSSGLHGPKAAAGEVPRERVTQFRNADRLSCAAGNGAGAAMTAELLTERRDSTLVLTLSDPAARNALSPQLVAAGIEALDSAEADPAVRAIVVQGTGGTFCAGGNLNGTVERRGQGRDAQRRMLVQLHRWIEAIRAHPKPVLAAVEGVAAGAGFSLALACDLVVAADDARFVLSYAKVGLTPDAGGLWQLARALPRQLVTELAWLAEPVSAQRLHGHGVVNAVVPRGGALDAALGLAARLAANAPNATAGAKELIDGATTHALGPHLDAERDAFLEALFHDNGGEGIAAFFERRKPVFR